jgi:hypothetical protein
MTLLRNKTEIAALFFYFFLPVLVLSGPSCQTAEGPKQRSFPGAEDAVVAMVDALKTNDQAELWAILGPEAGEALNSGDEVADQRGRDLFIAAYYERCVLEGDEKMKTLQIGNEDWPFPIPLVKEDAGWHFDTPAGIEELLYRRIGRNELSAITACEAYVAAQMEYAQTGRDGKPAGIYAQRFASEPGMQNGLYWEVQPGEPQSPFGELVAEAADDGYTPPGKPTPFWGYYFRILTAQGTSAEGGAKSYLVAGEMRDGFALVAYPAEYGNSGVMTFLVNQSGIVYEKDLGEDTAKLASEMEAYSPDIFWQPANSRDQ